MQSDIILKKKYEEILPILNEKQTRLILAAEAKSMGRGGLSKVSELSGMSRVTLNIGIKELLWTSKSLRNIAGEAKKKGCNISHKLVGVSLKKQGYSLQGNRKTDEGSSHEDRDLQFAYIDNLAKEFLSLNDPVISVDCKKKENIGNFKNAGTEWLLAKKPTKVNVYDFIDKDLGKAIPYGVYDVANNEGWVSVGISHDTAGFAVATIRSWWNEMGEEKFSKSKQILLQQMEEAAIVQGVG